MAPSHRRTKSSGPAGPSKTLVVDNGAYTIKAGLTSSSSDSPSTPSIIPNCLARDRDRKVYIGSQLSSCKDFSEIAFRRPVEKGYIVNWEAQKEIWEQEFFDEKAKLHCDPKETGLILTEAPNGLPVLQANCDQMVFEEFGFARYWRCPGMDIFSSWEPVNLLIYSNSLFYSSRVECIHRRPKHLPIASSRCLCHTFSTRRNSHADRFWILTHNHNAPTAWTTPPKCDQTSRCWWEAAYKPPHSSPLPSTI